MEKKTKYLYGAAVQGIQGFIFQTNKLREIVGASELVEEICTTAFDEFGGEKGPQNEKSILRAAGNIKHIFDSRKACEEAVKAFPKKVMEMAPGITVSQAVVKMEREFSEFKDAVGELEKRLRVQRNKLMRSATLGLMGIQRSRQTGLPVVLKPNDKGKNDLIDASTWAKLYEIDKKNNQVRKKTNLSLCKKAFCKTDEEKELLKHEQVAYDIEKITKNNDWIAIIHADGNGLGQIVQAIETDTQKFKKFSESLDKATQAAAVKAYDSVKGRFDKSKFIPIRPIVLGGDDFTVICRADLALDYVTEFIKQFEEKTKFVAEHKDRLGFDHLTACAGIAYIKSSFPFYYGYALAEVLCSRAKKDAKKDLKEDELPKSCLMFHKVQDSFTEDWDAIIRRELSPQKDISFEFGPYYVKEKKDETKWLVSDLTEKTKQFEGKEGNAVKSHLRNWISLLHDNPDMAVQKLERLKSMMPDTETGKKLLNMIKDVTNNDCVRDKNIVYPVYDILTIHTINTQKTKEE
ncbi:hypothetical protein [Tannerella forsythia]|uniref:Cas10/Cmr2 second palm domain-containing protein n=1 Tax=Tannerella forsythia TaxID=28112 RepID=UPI0028EED6FB|nr:hypothetical protein [Tannerella forsythia]